MSAGGGGGGGGDEASSQRQQQSRAGQRAGRTASRQPAGGGRVGEWVSSSEGVARTGEMTSLHALCGDESSVWAGTRDREKGQGEWFVGIACPRRRRRQHLALHAAVNGAAAMGSSREPGGVPWRSRRRQRCVGYADEKARVVCNCLVTCPLLKFA